MGKHSMARQNFSKACEDALNEQINAELYASYSYRAMAAYFDRDDIALPGFRDFFKKSAEEETEHAQIFIDYLNQRGGRVSFKPIASPKNEWTTRHANVVLKGVADPAAGHHALHLRERPM